MIRLSTVCCRALALLGIVFLLAGCARPRPNPSTTQSPPSPAPAPAPTPSPRLTPIAELRGVWVSDTTRLNWETATAELQRAGFNTMYVNFASGGAAFYPGSRVLPTVPGAAGADELARGIALAQRRGIEVHAKHIVLFMWRAPAEFQQRMIAADRVMRGPDGRPALQSDAAWLCPSQRANREMALHCVHEMLTRYAVAGLQLDYIRFYEQPTCYCAACRRDFERASGQAVSRWPADVVTGTQQARFADWQQNLINDWVREIAATARRARPGVVISAAVFPHLDRAREQKRQDWKRWLDRGDVDYVCTMTYTTDPREFDSLVRLQQRWARPQQQVVGIGSWKIERINDLHARIGATRQAGAGGFALFSYDDAVARNFLPRLGEASAAPPPPRM
jgi:uncharacterized lipoprotein YddW (UPF0748 family)